eukprot:CAMPEP_0172404024 /NCGR_PEP_ID=MMETSP1061-20121228/61564_1 /TAXON_ID=37318 /ORGANISM="Pseudo-nitzschia pungens, Strain cf. pungens" /LENGTH=755 /DNA_ID=CAMNT_0013138647 /DNA_START=227 /DNA_END=2491 /DNA_ORIENTATION=-
MRTNSLLSALPEINSCSKTPFLRSLGQPDWFDSLSSSPSSKRDVIRPYSSSLSSSAEHIGRSRSLVRWFQLQRQPQRQSPHRSYSTESDNRTATDSSGNKRGLNSNDIVADASDILLLEKAAFTAKHVEYGVVQSMETAIWKASSPAERRKMAPLLLPQLRNATEGLLNVTTDVESLSQSIEEIRVKRGRNAAAESSLRELHRAFLNLAQVLLDHLEAATVSNAGTDARDDDDDDYDDDYDDDDDDSDLSTNPTQLLEVALALSHRAHRLGLAYHWPLYQRLAIAVAKHPAIVDQKLPKSMAVALGALTNISRAEWIQTIHGWSKTAWGGGNGGDGKGIQDHPVFQTNESDLKWFHPSLKALAMGTQWSDVWYILMGLLRPFPQTRKEDEDHRHNRNGGFHSTESAKRSDYHLDNRDPLVTASQTNDDDSSNSRNDQRMNYLDQGVDNDDVVLSSPMILSYMDEELVLDILVPMNQQGLLNDLWNIGGGYPPPKSVEEACDIILMMEASIWKIFGGIPSRVKAGISNNASSMDQTEKYSLQDAIKILLKYEPTKRNQSNNQSNIADVDVSEAGEYFFDDHGKDSLTQALKDLEDLLDEHLGSEEDEDSEHDGNTTQQASEAIALATVLTNQIHLDDSAGNHDHNCDDFSTVSNADPQKLSDTGKMEVRVKRSGTEHVVEMTDLDDKSRHSEDRMNSFEDENNYLDFIYGDRAVDYEDNIPDVTSQLYEANGGKQLRYSSSLEHHIYEGMQQRLDY